MANPLISLVVELFRKHADSAFILYDEAKPDTAPRLRGRSFAQTSRTA